MIVDNTLRVYSGYIGSAKRLIAIRSYIHLRGWHYGIDQVTNKRI